MTLRFRAVNESNGHVLADHAERAARTLERLRGLLGRERLAPGEGLHIVPCNSIHTFFMRFPIDVLFLDEAFGVVSAHVAIPPWRATRIYAKARSVLELPAGTLAQTSTRAGDRVAFLPA